MKAVLEYYKSHYRPLGKRDSGGRWYPSADESCSCCRPVREPSREYPQSLYKHCHTIKHIRVRVVEKPTTLEAEALAMTQTSAGLYVNSESSPLLFHVAKKLLEGAHG
jgi:hypothetical protein